MMWWLGGCLGCGLCAILWWRIRCVQKRTDTDRTVSLVHQKPVTTTIAANQEPSEWEALSRDVQMHMHNLCVYRDAIKHALHDDVLRHQHDALQKWFERLICEIADHMTLIRRAHRLIHGLRSSRKETDPDIIKQALRRRCHNSALLCQELSKAIDIVDIKRRRSSTQGARVATASGLAGRASQQNQTSN